MKQKVFTPYAIILQVYCEVNVNNLFTRTDHIVYDLLDLVISQ
jgi:hypothetical protein